MASERHDHFAERAVVDVEHPLPGDAATSMSVAVVHVVVDQGRQQVVRGGQGREVAGEVQVDLGHRHHLAVATAGRAALHADTVHLDGSRRQATVISPSSKACMSYDPRTGREFWRVRYKSHSGAAMALFGHGFVYINTGFGAADLLAVQPDGEGDVTTSHVVWAARRASAASPRRCSSAT